MSKIYDSDYSVRLATLGAMGGDTTKCYDSVYEIDLEILKIIEEGGIGVQIDDSSISTETTWSSSKISEELSKLEITATITYNIDNDSYDFSALNDLRENGVYNIAVNNISNNETVYTTAGKVEVMSTSSEEYSQHQNIYVYNFTVNAENNYRFYTRVWNANRWIDLGPSYIPFVNDNSASNYNTYSSNKINTLVNSKVNVVSLTQAEYDALTTKDASTLYIISDAQ